MPTIGIRDGRKWVAGIPCMTSSWEDGEVAADEPIHVTSPGPYDSIPLSFLFIPFVS